jgi:transposase
MSRPLENMSQQELVLTVKQLENKNRKLEVANHHLGLENQNLQTKKQHLEVEKQNLESHKQNLEIVKQLLESAKQNLESKNQSLESENQYLQFRINQLNRLIFGSKRERFISNEQIEGQLELPFEVEAKPAEPEKTEQITYTRKKKKRENHPGRIPLPDHLPVEEVILEPNEDTTGLKCIGKEVTDKLELVPAKLFIKRYIRYIFIKHLNEQGLDCKSIIADLPVFPIEKGIAGAGLLAQIMVDKYVDHLPIYRQVKRFARENVRIPANTINGWQDAMSRLLYPLFEKHKQFVMGQGYLQVDETPIRVLDKDVKGKCHKGYLWAYNSPLQNAELFDYRPGRGREGPKEMLGDFKGYIQSDGYVVYEWFGKKENITLVSCWAHARRYFEKVLDYDRKAAEEALIMIQQLYRIERFARNAGLSPSERKELRLENALPILNKLGKWMLDTYKEFVPRGPLKDALQYTIPRWDNLLAYLYDGHLEIDNNLVENAIRPSVLGRKNYLFAGSHEGAQRAAMFYSFFGTCRKNNINPFEWLKDVLERIPTHKANKLFELLPQNWQKQQDKSLPH